MTHAFQHEYTDRNIKKLSKIGVKRQTVHAHPDDMDLLRQIAKKMRTRRRNGHTDLPDGVVQAISDVVEMINV